jgi:hypothetical protein
MTDYTDAQLRALISKSESRRERELAAEVLELRERLREAA